MKIYFKGKLFNMSKRFRMFIEDGDLWDDDETIVCAGSASDIRKVVRALEKADYYNLYAEIPRFKEPYNYVVEFPRFWSVGNCCYKVRKAKHSDYI